jgi:ParB family chromosome partitioning protein
MKIDIERIKVDETSRIRKDIGDLASLEQSIQQVGLINPILIDENDTLVAGFRRLSACKKLGYKEIEVHVVEMGGDELKMLETEVAENLFRKEFTPDEIFAIQKRREEIAEARRPKGTFERFWNWLTSLFKSDPKPEAEAEPATPDPAAPSQEPEKEEVREEPAAEATTEPAEQPAPETTEEPEKQSAAEPEPEPEAEPEPESKPESEPEPATETTQTEPAPPQPKAAEIIEKDGVRHIKWR